VVSSSYLLVLAAAMLPAGLLGDRYGHEKVMLVSLALFGVGSAACAASTSSAEFIAARVVLGCAGAGVVVMALSALTVLFSETERPRAVGVWSAANFGALPIGPILGGWLLSHVWWGWVFLMNLPVVAVGLIATAVLVPERLASARARPGRDRLLGGRPRRRDLWLRSRAYTWGVILIAVAILAMMGVLFTMPQFFQGVAGTDAMGSGLRLLPLVGGLVIGAVPADRVARHLGRS
jgi:MFS transporter, DHA2 family, multidrug resistance protein